MNPAAYLEMAETESIHWWYAGRRAILSSIIKTLNLPAGSEILEIGCGTGGNLQMLANFGTVSAVEMDETALEIASKKTNNRYDIRAGYCPDKIPFKDRSFDLIFMSDVLEHIEHDTEAMVAVRQLLKKNGTVILTVPAYQWLYGTHDIFLHHKRRYTASHLRTVISSAGFRSARISYMNTLLFPIAVMVRIKDRLFKSASASGTQVPQALINRIFSFLFSAERFFLKQFNFPFGVSLLCILSRSDDN